MQNDNNYDPFNNDEQQSGNETYSGKSCSEENSYQEESRELNSEMFRKEEQGEIPRWTPYEENYRNTNQQSYRPSNKRPSGRRWIIPLVIVLSIMLIAIVVGVIFGARRLSAYVERTTAQSEQTQNNTAQSNPTPAQNNTKDQAVLTQPGTNSFQSSANGKYILTDVSEIVDEVMPSVVSITSRALIESGGYGNYFNFFFGGGYGGSTPGETQEVDSGYGSGTIVSRNSEELLILTSYHVVEGSSSLYVTFIDGSSVDGYIKSQDSEKDIAIVAVPLSNIAQETLDSISTATLSKEEADVGDGAIVIGNALGYGMSVTTGIISAKDRQIQVDGKNLNVLQTDAAINGGNSGGCVINSNGEVIGISEAKIIISNVEGMCYAIPIASNYELIESLLNENGEAPTEGGQTVSEQGAYLGIRGRDIDNALANSYGMPKGIYVASTVTGSGAEKAGILEGDIIVGMDNVSFSTMNELQQQLSYHNPGDVVTLIIMRDVNGTYTQMKVEVTLSDSIS